ncbi:MAG TPA: hypothetical protein VGP69_05140 [Gaiellaceae bacterium]|jgi:hypothetical protein|nr:hypothetical protein [Gaiellaceae bacterium]
MTVFRWLALLGLAYAAYRVRQRRHTPQPPAETPPSPVADRVGAATAPTEEIVPGDLTSPGTVADPRLEARRAREAALRERESRASATTKFEDLQHEDEAERAEHVAKAK